MKRVVLQSRPPRAGFTLVEVLMSVGIAVVIIASSVSIYASIIRYWRGIELRLDADQDVNMAMNRMVSGVNNRLGLRSASAVAINTSAGGWTLTYATGGYPPQSNTVTYSASASNLVFNPGSTVIGRNISFARVVADAQSLSITLRVDRVQSGMNARRQIGSQVTWRNK